MCVDFPSDLALLFLHVLVSIDMMLMYDFCLLVLVVRLMMMVVPMRMDILRQLCTQMVIVTFGFGLDVMVFSAFLTTRQFVMVKHPTFVVFDFRFLANAVTLRSYVSNERTE